MLFRYAGIIQAHKSDVKTLDCKNDILVSGSRDGMVKVHDKNDLMIGEHSEHAPSYVNAVAIMRNGLIASAGTDNIINIWNINDKACIGALIGHTDNICSLYCNQDQSNGMEYLISSSWDKTARVWHEKECKYILQGHEGAVWRAIEFGHDTFITCSADKSIKIWMGDRCLHTIIGKGHSDVIRDIIKVSPDEFATVGNDGCICIWKLNGKLKIKWQGHDNFIYTIGKCGDLLLTAGEDRCIKVWNDQDCLQVIPIPAISIWKIVCLDSGIIYLGCNDGSIYKFNDDPKNIQDDSSFKLKLKDSKITFLEGFKIEDSLDEPGTRIGQVKVIKGKKDNQNGNETGNQNEQDDNKNNFTKEAYTWDGHQWQHVGQVIEEGEGEQDGIIKGVDGNGNSGKRGKKSKFQDKEYDFVFDVSVEDNLTLKLPFNIKDNPYRAAEQFIANHELSSNYIPQVAEFIMKNTPVYHLSTIEEDGNEDDNGNDKRKQSPSPSSPNSNFPSSSSSLSLFLQEMDCFKDAKLSGIQKKIREYNDNYNLELTESDLSQLFSYKNPILLGRLLETISLDNLFPILDLTRLYVLNNRNDLNFLVYIENHLISKILESKDIGPNLLMLIRLYSNLLYIGKIPSNKSIIPDLLRLALSAPKHHLPASSLLLNTCHYDGSLKSSTASLESSLSSPSFPSIITNSSLLLMSDPHVKRQFIAIILQYLRLTDIQNELIMNRILSSIYWLHLIDHQVIIKHFKVELELVKDKLENTRTISQINKILEWKENESK